MSTRQIEECFDLEKVEKGYGSFIESWIFDSSLISEEGMRRLMTPEPGRIIKLKRNTSMKRMHLISYGERRWKHLGKEE